MRPAPFRGGCLQPADRPHRHFKAHRLQKPPKQPHDRHGHEIYPAVSGRNLRPDKRKEDTGRRPSRPSEQLPPCPGVFNLMGIKR